MSTNSSSSPQDASKRISTRPPYQLHILPFSRLTKCQTGALVSIAINARSAVIFLTKEPLAQTAQLDIARDPHSRTTNTRPSDKLPGLRPRRQPIQGSSAEVCTDEFQTEDPGNFDDLMNNESIQTREFGDQNRVCFVGGALANYHYLMRQTYPQQVRRNVFHFGGRQYSYKDTSHNLQRIPTEALERPKKALADRLVRAYFDRINCGWPIVDEESFMYQYEKNYPSDPLPLTLLNAVLMVGAHVLADEDDEMKDLQSILFHRAKTLIDFRLDQDRVAFVQVAILMTWYSDGLEDIVANTWHWIGIATRTGLGLGMHRNTFQSMMQPHWKRIWTRLWWILFQFEFDTLASASLGRPQILNLDDSDVPELVPEHFKGIPNANIQFLIQQSKLCMIISRTARDGWSLRSTAQARNNAIETADEALASFLHQLPPELQLRATNITTWQAMLHLTYNNFVILIHRPPPKGGPDGQEDASYTRPHLCAVATVAISSILESLIDQNLICTLWYSVNHIILTAIINASTEIASSNPLTAAESQRGLSITSCIIAVVFTILGLFHMFQQRALRLKHRSIITNDQPLHQSRHGPDHFIAVDSDPAAQQLLAEYRTENDQMTPCTDLAYQHDPSCSDYASLPITDDEIEWNLLSADEGALLENLFPSDCPQVDSFLNEVFK
ncbi:unnamed protein product [Clonostachys rhizophaga]|uniref:Xylanolytic transcriptional activator regulatory domain-containing protein n=1 Tax=Clonostachys rhizophaga TaxID=160324 RepID=A0A9N9YJK0_9HYPO|nr:unnamed protein product [Clonostachys rhizophaga]